MILRQLEISNFRQITGTHTITFAKPGDNPVTVLLGENGAGKTTLLNSLQWCLYGQREFENEDEILSYKAIEQAEEGESITTSVKLLVDVDGQPVSIERSQNGQKRSNGTVVVGADDLRIDEMLSDGSTRPVNDATTYIKRRIPEQLAGFFFFKGEDLEALVAQSGSEDLKTAVENFVDLLVLDRALHHLQQAEKDLEKKLAAVTSGEARELTDQLAALDEDIGSAKAAVDAVDRECRQLAEQKEVVEDELATIEEVRPYVERKRELAQKIAHLTGTKSEKQQAVAKLVSRDGYLFLQSDVLRVGLRLAEDAREKGELPAKIKPQFVEDLLEEGECCCGTPIDAGMEKKLSGWKKAIKLADLESFVIGLKADLRHLESRARQFQADFEEARLEVADIDERLRTAVEEKSGVEAQLEGKDFELEHITGLQATLSSLSDQHVDAAMRAGRRRSEVERLEAQREALKERRDKKLEAEKEGARIGRQVDAVRKVRAALASLRSGWIGIVQRYLDTELKAKWKSMAQLDRLVEFDGEFRLNIKERGGDGEWRKSAPSSANRRALALGFVAALIRLADEASRDNKSTWFTGGRYPLVMDAPFATMDSHFKSTVPRGLRQAIPQLVLVTNHDQWDGEVEAALSDSIGASYVLELHRPGESSTTVRFRGAEVDYVVGESDSAFDWTEIRKIG